MAKIRMINFQQTLSPEQCFQEFLIYCKTKNLADKTIMNYSQQWKYFLNYFGDDTSILNITQDTITGYIRHLQSKISNPESINSALRNIRCIINYFHSQNYCQEVKIKLLKTELKVKEVYTDFELQILLRKPEVKKCKFTEFRTWAIINFLIGTGCRIRSLVNIKIQDIDLDNGLVKLTTTKNRKHQMLPLPESLQQVLRVFLKHRQGIAEDYLFCSENSNRLLETSVNHDVAGYNRARGVLKTGLHLFRHTFSKNYILQGGNVFTLQKTLGHSTLEMSRRYANLYDTDLQKGFETFNLLQRLQQPHKKIKM